MAQYLTGDQGSVTYTSGTGAETLQVADFGVWQATISRNVFSTTPFGYQIDRVTLGRPNVRGSFVGFMEGSAVTPPIPANASVPATMTLLLKTGRSYSFKARVFSLGIGQNSIEGSPTQQQYGFVSCGDSSADGITVA